MYCKLNYVHSATVRNCQGGTKPENESVQEGGLGLAQLILTQKSTYKIYQPYNSKTQSIIFQPRPFKV